MMSAGKPRLPFSKVQTTDFEYLRTAAGVNHATTLRAARSDPASMPSRICRNGGEVTAGKQSRQFWIGSRCILPCCRVADALRQDDMAGQC